MASTNKTTHYELSQYVGSDKPTYLVDYNTDMYNIDAGIYAAKSEADTNTTSIGTLTNLTTDAKSSLVGAINEVDGHCDTNASNIATNTLNIATNTTNIGTNTTNIGTMANLDTTTKSSLVGAINEVVEKFNLSTITDYTTSDMTITGATLRTGSKITIAKNSDGSICKIYGRLLLTSTGSGSVNVTIANTGISVDDSFTVSPCGDAGGSSTDDSTGITFNTDGSITLVVWNSPAYSSGTKYVAHYFPFIIFVTDFGDVNPS